MGFIDNKATAVNNVSIFEVLGNLPKGRITFSLNSISSKDKNLLPFLLDFLTILSKPPIPTIPNIGNDVRNLQQEIKNNFRIPNSNTNDPTNILVDILVEDYPSLVRILKEGIIQAIKAGLACGVDFTIPSPTPQLTLKITSIDFLNLLKTDPNTEIGSMFYGTSPNTDLNWFIYDLIQVGGTNSWKNIIDFSYDSNTEELTIKVNNSYAGKNFNVFLIDFINSIELLNLEVFVTKLTNLLTGNLDSFLGMSLDKLISLEKTNKLQDKINSSDPCKEDYDYQYDDSYFTFTNDEIYEIEKKSIDKFNGVTTLNLGCGLVTSTVNPTTSKSVFDEIKSTPPSKINNVIKKSMDLINNDLTSNVPESDKNVAKLSLNFDLINNIPKILTNVVLEPKIVILYQISLKTVNDVVLNVTNSFDYAKATKVFFEYVVRESLAAILEIIFKYIKKQVLLLVSQIAAKIIKDQIKLKIKAISSIVTGVVDNQLILGPLTVKVE